MLFELGHAPKSFVEKTAVVGTSGKRKNQNILDSIHKDNKNLSTTDPCPCKHHVLASRNSESLQLMVISPNSQFPGINKALDKFKTLYAK